MAANHDIQTQCPLLDLPPELRITIYEMLFSFEGPCACWMKLSPPQSRKMLNSPHYNDLAMLPTCQTIRNEAQGIVYSINHFQISIRHLDSFLTETSHVRAASITHLEFRDMSPHHIIPDLQVLCAFMPRLRSLQLKLGLTTKSRKEKRLESYASFVDWYHRNGKELIQTELSGLRKLEIFGVAVCDYEDYLEEKIGLVEGLDDVFADMKVGPVMRAP
ncbi:hypothetical protein LTR37_020423 [Vermiconidia calcicola]|uniref:Uncharacterized protein n=1 Tax=Vermiconidia calcicola TaxID=1690605 RepID=A0ACC3MEF1_9PEZI|nr:hypothetical protein LTR37_020423 [Vermiconidia calcicola]